MAMNPDAVAALFDLPPAPAPASAAALEAEEAALAAELASALASGDVAGDAPDSRANLRVDVAWTARMQLPDGDVIPLRVRNVSESGVGLLSDQRIPASALVKFEMDVPPPDGQGEATPVGGTIKTTYAVSQGAEIRCGATWQAPPAGIALVRMWVTRLRR